MVVKSPTGDITLGISDYAVKPRIRMLSTIYHQVAKNLIEIVNWHFETSKLPWSKVRGQRSGTQGIPTRWEAGASLICGSGIQPYQVHKPSRGLNSILNSALQRCCLNPTCPVFSFMWQILINIQVHCDNFFQELKQKLGKMRWRLKWRGKNSHLLVWAFDRTESKVVRFFWKNWTFANKVHWSNLRKVCS